MRPIILITALIYPSLCVPQSSTFQEVICFGQSSTQTDEIVSTADGGYAVAGVTNIGGNAECFIARYNSSGTNQWTKIYYDEQSHQIYSGTDDTEIFCNQYVRFLVAYNDGFVVGGGIDSAVFITYSSGATVGYNYTRMFAVCTDGDGNLVWSKKFVANDNTFGEEAIVTSDGSLLIAGSVTQPGLVLRDIALLKLNTNGDIKWARSYGGPFDEGVARVVEASPSQWMICGTSESFSNNQNIYVLNTDSSGQLSWSNVYGSSAFDYGKGIVKANDGYYLFGNAGNGNPSYIALTKIDSTGTIQWANTYGNYLFDSPEELFMTSGGTFVMLVDHYGFSHDMLACEVDAEGNTLNSRIYGDSSGDDFVSSMISDENAFTIVGATNSFGGSQFINNGYIVRTHDGLISDCFSEPINYNSTPVSLATTVAATSVSVLDAKSYAMMVSVLDSFLIVDTVCFSVSTSVNTVSTNTIQVYPNPADKGLTIHNESSVKSVSIYDLAGRQIVKKNVTSNQEIYFDTAALPEGTYLITIKTVNDMFCQKLVVTH